MKKIIEQQVLSDYDYCFNYYKKTIETKFSHPSSLIQVLLNNKQYTFLFNLLNEPYKEDEKTQNIINPFFLHLMKYNYHNEKVMFELLEHPSTKKNIKQLIEQLSYYFSKSSNIEYQKKILQKINNIRPINEYIENINFKYFHFKNFDMYKNFFNFIDNKKLTQTQQIDLLDAAYYYTDYKAIDYLELFCKYTSNKEYPYNLIKIPYLYPNKKDNASYSLTDVHTKLMNSFNNDKCWDIYWSCIENKILPHIGLNKSYEEIIEALLIHPKINFNFLIKKENKILKNKILKIISQRDDIDIFIPTLNKLNNEFNFLEENKKIIIKLIINNNNEKLLDYFLTKVKFTIPIKDRFLNTKIAEKNILAQKVISITSYNQLNKNIENKSIINKKMKI